MKTERHISLVRLQVRYNIIHFSVCLKTSSFFCVPGLTRNIIRLNLSWLDPLKNLFLLCRHGQTHRKKHLSFAGPAPWKNHLSFAGCRPWARLGPSRPLGLINFKISIIMAKHLQNLPFENSVSYSKEGR